MNDAQIGKLLAAERRGRLVALYENPAPGSVWRIVAGDTPDGNTLLAAARWGARLGAAVSVEAVAPDTPSPIWSALAESCRKQGFMTGEPASPDTTDRLVGNNPYGGVNTVFPSLLPAADAAWGMTLGQSHAFVRKAVPDDAILSCAQCREVDKKAMEIFGVSGVCLMENAAMGGVAVAMDMMHSRRGTTLFLAGGGNNGGDALAMARGFTALGLECAVVLAKPASALRGDAAVNYRLLRGHGDVPVHELADDPDRLPPLLENSSLLVDGLLGTGFAGTLSPDMKKLVDHVNASDLPVLGLDLPSGLNGDTGETGGAAVRCERTVTFAALKPGLLRGDGPATAGRLYCADIGAPSASYE